MASKQSKTKMVSPDPSSTKRKLQPQREPYLDANEFAKLLGYATSREIDKAVLHGEIPKPEIIVGQLRKRYWSMSTAKRILAERNSLTPISSY